MALLTICAMTIREAVRRRLLAAVGILSLIIVGLTGWAMHKIVTSQGTTAPVPSAGRMSATRLRRPRHSLSST